MTMFDKTHNYIKLSVSVIVLLTSFVQRRLSEMVCCCYDDSLVLLTCPIVT